VERVLLSAYTAEPAPVAVEDALGLPVVVEHVALRAEVGGELDFAGYAGLGRNLFMATDQALHLFDLWSIHFVILLGVALAVVVDVVVAVAARVEQVARGALLLAAASVMLTPIGGVPNSRVLLLLLLLAREKFFLARRFFFPGRVRVGLPVFFSA